MKNLKIYMMIVCICYAILMLTGCVEKKEKVYMFKLNKNYVSGTYTGEKENLKPNGEGTFVCTDEERKFEKYIGKWKEGLPSGKGTVWLSDGRVLEGSFKEGMLHGIVTIKEKDDSFSTMRFSKGIPYGKVGYYDASGQETGKDYYFAGKLLTTIKNEVIDFSYEEILAAPKTFTGSYGFLSGTVEKIYENEEKVYLVVQGDDNRNYIVYYCNTSPVQYKQALVPNSLKQNDRIRMYGRFQGCKNEIEYKISEAGYCLEKITLQATVPFLEAVQIEKQQSSEGPGVQNYLNEYDNLKEFPYESVGEIIKSGGVIQNITIDYQKNYTYYEVDTLNGEKYFLLCRYKIGKKLKKIGSYIQFEGICRGNYKVKQELYDKEIYEKYPLIKITEIEEKDR